MLLKTVGGAILNLLESYTSNTAKFLLIESLFWNHKGKLSLFEPDILIAGFGYIILSQFSNDL
jgi:hypothetical protein